MTDLKERDDSGEILPWDTVVLEAAEPTQPTRPLTKYLRTLPPLRALRLADAHPERAHDTGEFPLIATGAELVVAAREYPPIGPGPHPGPDPRPGPSGPKPGPPPPVRPDGYRPRHRKPVPALAWLSLGFGTGFLAAAGAMFAVARTVLS